MQPQPYFKPLQFSDSQHILRNEVNLHIFNVLL